MNMKRERTDKLQSATPVKKKKQSKDSYTIEKSNNSAENKSNLSLNLRPRMTKMLAKDSKEKKSLNYKQNKEKAIDIALKTVEDLHREALDKFDKLKVKKTTNYKDILNQILNIYDLDENINEFFLKKLNDYYQKHKNIIDNDLGDESSDKIAALFLKFILTLSYTKRVPLLHKFNYFGDKELFFKEDKKYFYEEPLDVVFKNFIMMC